MKELKRMLTATLMLCILSVGAFAQNQNKDDQRRPPREGEKVKEAERKDGGSRNQGKDGGGNKGGSNDNNKRGRP